jgi:hypothetical protein
MKVSKGKKLDFVSLSDTVPAVLWIHILIRINLAVLDPDPDRYWECGSGSRSMEIGQNLQNLVLCLSKCCCT